MEGSIRLTAGERKTALQIYRGAGDARMARRAHILLLLADGRSYREIMEIDYSGSDLVAAVKRRFLEGGLKAALAEPTEDGPIPFWQIAVAGWVMHKTPRDFGYFRSRWTCELLSQQLRNQYDIRLSGEAVRRGLHELGFAWRRPRPVVGPTIRIRRQTPQNQAFAGHLARPRKSPSSKTRWTFNLNPKIGSCWMIRGEQAER